MDKIVLITSGYILIFIAAYVLLGIFLLRFLETFNIKITSKHGMLNKIVSYYFKSVIFIIPLTPKKAESICEKFNLHEQHKELLGENENSEVLDSALDSED